MLRTLSGALHSADRIAQRHCDDGALLGARRIGLRLRAIRQLDTMDGDMPFTLRVGLRAISRLRDRLPNFVNDAIGRKTASKQRNSQKGKDLAVCAKSWVGSAARAGYRQRQIRC
jgi:hypothetical protein